MSEKRRMGDRWDGKLIRDLDALHYVMPHVYPGRCNNEAYISERIDLEPTKAYIAKKNAENPVFDYTFFHIIVAALLKTITLRPKMNRFIANKNYYQRNEVSAGFIVKKIFTDEGAEGMAIIRAKEDDNINTLHEQLYKQISGARSGGTGSTEDSMEILTKMPRFLSRFLIWVIYKLEKRGKCPRFLIAQDPYYCSVILSNLGSLQLKCGYHHLTEWGTSSLFCIVGEYKPDKNGHDCLDIGLTIDERIADGYYYSKTLKLFRHLMANPELLELPMSTPVDFE